MKYKAIGFRVYLGDDLVVSVWNEGDVFQADDKLNKQAEDRAKAIAKLLNDEKK